MVSDVLKNHGLQLIFVLVLVLFIIFYTSDKTKLLNYSLRSGNKYFSDSRNKSIQSILGNKSK